MIKKTFSKLTTLDSTEQVFKILFSWRLYLVGAILGAALGYVFYSIFPPVYRAQATVVIDQNTEEAWVYFPDRQLFHYLQRETQKLEEVAWANETLQLTAEKLEGITIEDLQEGLLILSYPEDGPWHFYGLHPDAEIAQDIASAWAQSFATQAWKGIEISPELEAARSELENILASDPDTPWEQIVPFWDEIDRLHEETLGISSYIELSLSEVENPIVSRSASLSLYLLGGSFILVFLFLITGLFFLTPEVKND